MLWCIIFFFTFSLMNNILFFNNPSVLYSVVQNDFIILGIQIEMTFLKTKSRFSSDKLCVSRPFTCIIMWRNRIKKDVFLTKKRLIFSSFSKYLDLSALNLESLHKSDNIRRKPVKNCIFRCKISMKNDGWLYQLFRIKNFTTLFLLILAYVSSMKPSSSDYRMYMHTYI
jgi:hypothetical protein